MTREQLLQQAVEDFGKARAHEMALWLSCGGRPMQEFLLEAEAALAKVEAARARIFAIVNGDTSEEPRNRRRYLRISDLPRIVANAERRADEMAGACAPYGTVARARGRKAPASNLRSGQELRAKSQELPSEARSRGADA